MILEKEQDEEFYGSLFKKVMRKRATNKSPVVFVECSDSLRETNFRKYVKHYCSKKSGDSGQKMGQRQMKTNKVVIEYDLWS